MFLFRFFTSLPWPGMACSCSCSCWWWRCWRTDLSGFIKLLELPKYTSVVKTLNAGINVDTDNVNYNGDGVGADDAGDDDDVRRGVDPTKEPRQQQQQQSQMKQLSADILSASAQQAKQQHDAPWNARSMSQCHQLAEQLTRDYNKSIVFWPCPQMKVSSSCLENNLNLLKFKTKWYLYLVLN